MNLWLCTRCGRFPAAAPNGALEDLCYPCKAKPIKVSKLLAIEEELVNLLLAGAGTRKLAQHAKCSTTNIDHWLRYRGRALAEQQKVLAT